MWNTEKQFSKTVMDKMKKEGMMPIRVESASTVSGMPDMYALGYNNDWFIELKNIKDKSIKDAYWKIPWRPGQQAWAQQYAAHHTTRVFNMFLSSKYSWTFVGLNDGILLIRMSHYKKDNKVFAQDSSVFKFSIDEFRKLNINWFLRTHSQVVTPILHRGMTWSQYVYRQMKYDIEEVLGHHYFNVDIPTPEDIIDEVAPELKNKLSTAITPIEWHNNDFMNYIQRNIAEQAALVYLFYIENEMDITKLNINL